MCVCGGGGGRVYACANCHMLLITKILINDLIHATCCLTLFYITTSGSSVVYNYTDVYEVICLGL